MRIAQITARYYPYVGGVDTVVENLATGMVKKGHCVEVLTLDPGGDLPPEEERQGVVIRRFPERGPYNYSAQLQAYLKESRYDIVHAHSLHTFIPQMVTAAKSSKTPWQLVITGHYHGRGKTSLSSLFLLMYRPIVRNFASRADGFICVSGFEADLLKRHFGMPEEKIVVIPNGVALDKIEGAEPRQTKARVILAVSRLEKYKNIDMAIKAMPYLPEDVQLVIIGDGPDRGRLTHLVKYLNLTNRVSLLGVVSQNEVYEWYQTCKLVINLSRLEAFGLTIIEGLAAGKAILVNDKTALSELSRTFEGVTAVDVAMMTGKELAAAVEVTLGASIHNVNLNEYKWDVIVDRVYNAYCNTCAHSRSTQGGIGPCL